MVARPILGRLRSLPARPNRLMDILRQSAASVRGPEHDVVNGQSLAMSAALEQLNEAARASFGLPLFGRPELAPDRVVLLIMTYSRTGYVRRLLESLSRSVDIQETEVIVSTDGYNKDLAEVIRRVTTFPVRQVFFPASPHLFPSMHPGRDPRDCGRDATREEQEKSGCLGDPDRFGHYREAKYVSLKLHWAWLWNWVFGVLLRPGFLGSVMVVEDDVVATSRYFYINAKQLYIHLPLSCPDCRGISLMGPQAGGRRTMVLTGGNKAYGYTRAGWSEIARHGRQFCRYGDYNWDVSADWLPSKKFGMLTPGVPQGVVLGNCGLHGADYDEEKCKETVSIQELVHNTDHSIIDGGNGWEIAIGRSEKHHEVPPEGGGGWGDARDVALCDAIFELSA